MHSVSVGLLNGCFPLMPLKVRERGLYLNDRMAFTIPSLEEGRGLDIGSNANRMRCCITAIYNHRFAFVFHTNPPGAYGK